MLYHFIHQTGLKIQKVVRKQRICFSYFYFIIQVLQFKSYNFYDKPKFNTKIIRNDDIQVNTHSKKIFYQMDNTKDTVI